ncbi:hypothetical protein D3C76_748710 [compost metagenome]
MNERKKCNLQLYHGTNEKHSRNILQNGFKIQKEKRKDHWLGTGVYFFREDMEQALVWACDRYKNEKDINEAHVIKYDTDVNNENFLNLDTRGGMSKFKKHSDEFRRQTRNIKFSSQSVDELRYLIMNLLPKEYYIVQRTFQVKSSFDNDFLLGCIQLSLHGTQVCIRNCVDITGGIEVVKTQKTS